VGSLLLFYLKDANGVAAAMYTSTLWGTLALLAST
jgi:hypothetical protein